MPNYTDEQKKEFAEHRRAQLEAITEKLEQGISEVYSSENYVDYLKTMAKFHSYSVRNSILIHMQRPDATLVAGFDAWKKFKRHVKRGEVGIKIYAPVIRKRNVQEEEQAEPEKNQDAVVPEDVIEGQESTAEGQPQRKSIVSFKIQNVFDISQTDGEPLHEVTPTILDNDVADYDNFLTALVNAAKVPVSFQTIEGSANGYFHRGNNEIVVSNDMPELQTAKTLVHEIAHSRLHRTEGDDIKKEVSELPAQHIRELQAESVAFVVMSHYGLDSGEYSFPYVAMWAQDRDLTELRENLEVIRDTSSTIIDDIDKELNALEQEKEAALDMDEALEGQNAAEDMPRPYRYYITEEAVQSGAYPQQENMLTTETAQKQFYENQTVEAYGFIDYAQPLTLKELEEHHLVPSDDNPLPPVTEAAYQIGNGDFLEVHLADEGWLYTLYDKNFAEVDSECLTGPQTVEEARDEVLSKFHLDKAASFVMDYGELQKRLDLIEAHNLSPAVLPYVMERNGGKLQLDTAVEPVVTFMESTHPAFREGMKLPLHLAETFTSDINAEVFRKNRGKGADKEHSSVVARIDYQLKDGEHHHHDTFQMGDKKGGLLLSVERNANDKIYQFERHPDEGNPEPWKNFVEKHIPVLYQQSMKAENKVLDEILQPPTPFYNMPLKEAKSDPAIGWDAFFRSHNATVACKKEMDYGLETACHHKAVYQFMDRMNRQFGPERVKAVLAATIQHRDFDGRFHRDVRDYANQVVFRFGNTEHEQGMKNAYVMNAHSVIVDGTMMVCRKMEQQRESERKPSIRGRLGKRQASQKNAPARTQEQTQKRAKQNAL